MPLIKSSAARAARISQRSLDGRGIGTVEPRFGHHRQFRQGLSQEHEQRTANISRPRTKVSLTHGPAAKSVDPVRQVPCSYR